MFQVYAGIFICQLQSGIMFIVYFIEGFRDILLYLALLFARCITIVHFKHKNYKGKVEYTISVRSRQLYNILFTNDIINCCGRF